MFVVLLAVSGSSKADSPRLTVDWARFVTHGTDWVVKLGENGRAPDPRPPPTQDATWFGLTPHLSLLARDWKGGARLAGAQLTLTDSIRLSRSSQMIMTRVRLGEKWSRIQPFAQIGFGQWRVDTDLMPQMRQDPEIAAQSGAGLEIRLTRAWQLAAEFNVTVLYREKYEPEHFARPRMWGSFLASRVEF